MENINVISGTGDITKEKVNVLLDAAIEFYGPKYESLILDVVRTTLFYEMDKNESIDNAISNISGQRSKIKNEMPKACHISLGYMNESPIDAVIWKPQKEDIDYHILGHELYGHGVCGRNKTIVNQHYKRNGITLYDLKRQKEKLLLINEGFMENIASSIIKLTNRDIVDITSEKYDLARRSTKYIMNILGKEKIIEDLVEYKKIIENEYNQDSKINYLSRLDKIIQLEMQAKNIFPDSKPFFDKKAKKELKKFKQRKSR